MTTLALFLLTLSGQISPPPTVTTGDQPGGQEAIRSGEKAIQGFRIPPGFKVELFAAEPHLTNPVAFTIDEKNRFYVVETNRLHQGVLDIRGYMKWLNDDLACKSVANRVELLKKIGGDKFPNYEKETERVRMIVDDNGDGRADRSWVFAEGFNKAEDGLAAGLLVRGKKAWLTCIPNLWLLQDTESKGIATQKTSLHKGFGVHIAFIGHDLHGITMGPDGRLYFSIGDRGTQTVPPSPNIQLPHTGAVFRCEPDGSNLEVFCTGLRNPQELAFDALGNLFTVDNNSDGGDQARVAHLVPGGDSGWRFGYQFIEKPNPRGPWNSEGIWKPRFPGQPAYIIPPLINLSSGPSGLAFYPGTGFPVQFRDHFFLCDFRGSPGNSGIWSFSFEPDGAGYKLKNPNQFLWSVLATDLEFSPDGSLYVSDWVDGWNKPGKGRIYKISPLGEKSLSVKDLLAQGFYRYPINDLLGFLKNPDLRVRREAQFVLAAKGKNAVPALMELAQSKADLLPRVHALWALEQIGRKDPGLSPNLLPLLQDDDPEIRAQTAKVLGEIRQESARVHLAPLLKDPQLRVRSLTALALAKLPAPENSLPLLQCLEANQNQDVYIRHGCVMALAAIPGEGHLVTLKDNPSPAIRLGAVLALRRKSSPGLSLFLNDTDPLIVEESARAIHDLGITQALPALAKLPQGSQNFSPNLWRRVLAANYRIGGAEAANHLARLAANRQLPESVRIESLQYLEIWSAGSGPDPVTGLWNPRPGQPAEESAKALEAVLPQVLSSGGNTGKKAAVTASLLKIRSIIPALHATLDNAKETERTRLEALKGLETLADAELPAKLPQLLKDTSGKIRAEALRIKTKATPQFLWETWDSTWNSGSVVEKQALIQLLGEFKTPAAKVKLDLFLKQWTEGKLSDELKVEVWEAASKQNIPLKSKGIGEPNPDRPGIFSFALIGGDADKGKDLFHHKTEISCLRCHKIQGLGGDVGPELGKLGAQQNRPYILEALVNPNKQIAKGFAPVLFSLSNGKTVLGILRAETAKEVILMTHEGKLLTIAKVDIEERKQGLSAMPADLHKLLSPRELRDLVEYLSSLK